MAEIEKKWPLVDDTGPGIGCARMLRCKTCGCILDFCLFIFYFFCFL